ncbi:hypothetical protein NUW58_g8158 [Xylaria curta]|uniref:Uncharacterized protein n=1 Tax=Xylaria curta TaxID=42375 RepID=A0ACC1NAX6_9PEZI|nr:hypothetical protein NUW58_g8158 [Xylaria curta]
MTKGNPPWAFRWRSNTLFIIATVAVGLFTDLFLYGLVVPVLPFMLQSRLSSLLAAYAGASVVSSVPAGWIADRTNSRRAPFLSGLVALLAATIMLALGRSITVLVIARVLQGISAAVVWTIGLAMVLDTVGPRNLGKVIGSVSCLHPTPPYSPHTGWTEAKIAQIFSFISIGELLAPVIGGVLYEKSGYTGVFGLGAGMLVLDFLMRLLVVEEKTAARYSESAQGDRRNSRQLGSRPDEGSEEAVHDASEEDPLLPKQDDEAYKIMEPPSRLVTNFPILVCFRSPRLFMSFCLAFVQASLLAVYDATIPTEAQSLFQFSPLKAGLLFIALDVPYLLLGPVAGWAVDRYGTKLAAVVGFGWMAPMLVLLRLPSDELLPKPKNIILYCALLALNGIGLAVIGSPSVVEASDVVQKYDRANPGLFGKNGPYAQLYGFNSLFFCAGLTTGPIVAGALKDSIGYGNMNLMFAILSAITAVLSFVVRGGLDLYDEVADSSKLELWKFIVLLRYSLNRIRRCLANRVRRRPPQPRPTTPPSPKTRIRRCPPNPHPTMPSQTTSDDAIGVPNDVAIWPDDAFSNCIRRCYRGAKRRGNASQTMSFQTVSDDAIGVPNDVAMRPDDVAKALALYANNQREQ